MSNAVLLLLALGPTYLAAQMMKNAGRNWVVGAALGFVFNLLGLLIVLIITKKGTKGKTKRISAEQKFASEQFRKLLSYVENSVESFSESLEILKDAEADIAQNKVLLTIIGVELHELRKGTAVATTTGTIDAKMRSGTIGLSGKHIGIAATSGALRGKTKSTTITPPAPESLQRVDFGKILVRPDVIAFVGSKYSKSIEYKDVLDWVSNDTSNPFTSQLTLSVKGAGEVIVFQLWLESEADFLSKLLGEVTSSKNLVLDSSLMSRFLISAKDYVNSRKQEATSIQKVLDNQEVVSDAWKKFALNGEFPNS